MTKPFAPEADPVQAHTHAETDVTSLSADLLARFNYRGAWAGSTAYALNDVVTIRGMMFLCTTAHTSSGSSVWDPTKWFPVTSQSLHAVGSARVATYHPGSLVDQTKTQTVTLNRLYLAPAYAARDITISKLACGAQAGVASATHRLGIYVPSNSDYLSPLNPQTFTLAVDAGTVDTSTSGQKEITLGTPVNISANTWFYLAGVSQGAASTMYTAGGSNALGFSPLGQITSNPYQGGKAYCYYVDSVSGALAATVTNAGNTINMDGGVGYYRSA